MAGDPTKLYEQFQPPERLTLIIEAMARNDAAEAQRLHKTCPRVTYTGQDLEFADRWSMAFDTLAVVTIDLRCMWGKLHILHWVMGNVHPIATGHHITAGLAFVDGVRCGRGLPQCEFFAKPPPEPQAGDGEDDPTDGHVDDELTIDDDEDDDNDDEVQEPTPRQSDEGLRLHAVQDRAEHFTNRGMVALLGAASDIAQDLVNTWAAFGQFCRTRLGVSPETMLRAWEFPLDEFEEILKRCKHVKPDPAKVEEYTGYICKHWDGRFDRSDSEYLTYGDDGDGE